MQLLEPILLLVIFILVWTVNTSGEDYSYFDDNDEYLKLQLEKTFARIIYPQFQ